METQEVDKIRLLQGEIQCLHQQMRSFFAAQEASRRLWGMKWTPKTGQGNKRGVASEWGLWLNYWISFKEC